MRKSRNKTAGQNLQTIQNVAFNENLETVTFEESDQKAASLFKSSSSGKVQLLRQENGNTHEVDAKLVAKNFSQTQAVLNVPTVEIQNKSIRNTRQSQTIRTRHSKMIASNKNSGKQSLSHSRTSFVIQPKRENLYFL